MTETAQQNIQAIKTGQKMAIYAIFVMFAAIAGFLMLGPIAGRLLQLGGIVLSIWGIVKIGSGFNYSTGMKVLLVVLMFIPLISLFTLLRMNGKATVALRNAGMKVGLLGAK